MEEQRTTAQNVKDKTFYLNQREAQEQKKGIWSKRYPAPPWEWRKARRR